MDDAINQSDALARDLGRLGQGDQSALQRVYKATSNKLFGVCLAVLRDRELAEDVLQEVYIKVWHRAARFDPGKASPITWLCVIARNSAIDRRRALDRMPTGSDDQLMLIADEREAADTMIEAMEDQARIHLCIAKLEENQRRSIRAAFYDGLTYLELAQQRGVPLGTVKSWIRRGLARLKTCVDEND